MIARDMDIQKHPIFLLFVLIHICPIQIDKPIMYILYDKKSTAFSLKSRNSKTFSSKVPTSFGVDINGMFRIICPVIFFSDFFSKFACAKGPFLCYVRVFLAFFRPPTHPCKE